MKLKMPAIVGELCAGVLAGPSVLAHLAPSASTWLLPHNAGQIHLLDAVAQIGLVLLVGITGMQLDLRLIRRRAGTAAITGISGLVISLAAGLGPSTDDVPHSNAVVNWIMRALRGLAREN